MPTQKDFKARSLMADMFIWCHFLMMSLPMAKLHATILLAMLPLLLPGHFLTQKQLIQILKRFMAPLLTDAIYILFRAIHHLIFPVKSLGTTSPRLLPPLLHIHFLIRPLMSMVIPKDLAAQFLTGDMSI